jgi:hypothetical protein
MASIHYKKVYCDLENTKGLEWKQCSGFRKRYNRSGYAVPLLAQMLQVRILTEWE